jgi:hypothetical protein
MGDGSPKDKAKKQKNKDAAKADEASKALAVQDAKKKPTK